MASNKGLKVKIVPPNVYDDSAGCNCGICRKRREEEIKEWKRKEKEEDDTPKKPLNDFAELTIVAVGKNVPKEEYYICYNFMKRMGIKFTNKDKTKLAYVKFTLVPEKKRASKSKSRKK